MNKWSTETKMLAGEIDSCKYLYLREINEPRDNWLRLAVEEATAGTELMHVLPGLCSRGDVLHFRPGT
jgi:hypothetical protein